MSTPSDNDPFTQRPAGDTAPPRSQSAPPPLPLPGQGPPPPPLPGQAPPPGGFAPALGVPRNANTFALIAIVVTGLYVLFALGSAFFAQDVVDSTKKTLISGEPSTSPMSLIIQLLSTVVSVGAFVVLALWMARIRSNLKARGITAGGPPAVEWWGWFVPLANFVLPLLGMKAIARKKVGMGLLLGWWIPFCLMWIVSFAAGLASIMAVDLMTGELTNLDALNASVPLTYASTAAVIVSWVFLVVIIRRITDRHLED